METLNHPCLKGTVHSRPGWHAGWYKQNQQTLSDICSIVASWDGTNIAQKSFSVKLLTATPITAHPSPLHTQVEQRLGS